MQGTKCHLSCVSQHGGLETVSRQKAVAFRKIILSVFHLSRATVLYYLMDTVLQTILSYGFVHFLVVLGRRKIWLPLFHLGWINFICNNIPHVSSQRKKIILELSLITQFLFNVFISCTFFVCLFPPRE